jgi:sporulation protein YlmC with PRC-barrel domain
MRMVGTAFVAGTIGVFFLLADGGWIRAGTGTGGIAKQNKAPIRENHKFVNGGRFKQLAGKKVENVDGEEIGTIKDLVLQRRSGQVHYVIVRSNGLFHRRLVIVPLFAIAMTTAKVGIASIDISTRQWKQAPELRKQDLVLLAEPERAQSVGRFYDRAGAWLRTAQSPEMRAGLSSTGRKSADPPRQKENGELEMANDLVGKELIDREHKDFGKVADLLINFSEKKPVLALVTVTQESGTDESFLVPIRLLSPAGNGKLQIDADRDSFERAQPFSFEDWQGLETGQNEIYRWARR